MRVPRGHAELSVVAMARRTVDLLNTLHPGEPPEPPDTERLERVVAVLREYGDPDPVDLDQADLRRLTTVAPTVRRVFTATDPDSAAEAVNSLLAQGTGPLRLSSHHGRTPWHPHLDGDDDAPWHEWFLASSGLALAVLLWDRQRPPGGTCSAPGCSRVFLAQGSGPTRRYCSRRCATRVRVAAHRARAR
ncbi:CGNR zinc finger domain-containing protein [Streptomyces sp. NPDC005438]|uniref:CGNR zinc finger domain-containing protein n=1 Tax=Streptomyces sp. NPDC005438 TaxID=3156880 RepID=UPI0033BA58FA